MAQPRRSAENTVRVDEKRRIVLPKGVPLAEFYAVEVTNDEIILRPRALVDPRETFSKRTLEVLDASMRNHLQGKVGEPIDLNAFNHLSEEDHEQQAQSKTGRSSRRR